MSALEILDVFPKDVFIHSDISDFCVWKGKKENNKTKSKQTSNYMVAYKINSDVNMSNIQQNYFPMSLWAYPLERGKGYSTV